jgi:hypothetical protein
LSGFFIERYEVASHPSGHPRHPASERPRTPLLLGTPANE